MKGFRLPHFEPKPRSISDWCAVSISTGLFSGCAVKAPGTAGSVIGLVTFLGLYPLSPSWQVGVWFLVFLFGIWATEKTLRMSREADPGFVVIDEVLGFWLTAAALGTRITPINLAVAFLLFRIFDILKPWPIRFFDRWSKRQKNLFLASFGIILDDLIAGLIGAVVIRALFLWGWQF
jgi:phosphatidylglycerophosphatase A